MKHNPTPSATTAWGELREGFNGQRRPHSLNNQAGEPAHGYITARTHHQHGNNTMIRRLTIVQNLFSAVGHLLNDAQRVAVIDLLVANYCSWPLPGREKHLKRADLARYLDESAELVQNCEPELFFELRALLGAAMKFLRVEADCDRLTSAERMFALRALRNLVFARPCGVHLFSNIKDPRFAADWLEDSTKAFGAAPGATIMAELTETWDAVMYWKDRPIADAAERMAAIKLARNGEPATSSPRARENRRLAAVA